MLSKKQLKTSILFSSLLLIIGLSIIFTAESQAASNEEYFFKIRILVNNESDGENVASLLAQDLRRICIDSSMYSYPGGSFESAVLSREFDIVFIDMVWPNTDVDPTYFFSENGSANYWDITSEMAGGQDNENYLIAGKTESNELARIDTYYDWQENLMANILPIIPLYNDVTTYVSWNTLDGWDHEEGIIASLPYMEWSSLHTGQENQSVFVDYADEWNQLNPLFVEDDFYVSLISEPLLRINKNGEAEPVLAESWSYNTNKTILTINLRDNIIWQPDVDQIYTSEQLSTDDIIFSIQMYKEISTIGSFYNWIVDMVKENDLQLKLVIDGDKNSPGLQPYAPALNELDKLILPEHYLNVSLDIHGLPDISDDNWITYGANGIGTGMYYLKRFTDGVESIFSRNDVWWGTRPDAFNEDLDIAEYKVRFLPDLTAKLLEFYDGALDVFKDYYEYMTDFNVVPYQKQIRSEYDVTYIGFNLQSLFCPEIGEEVLCEDETMTKGLAVRKAIAYMIDKNVIVDLLDSEVDMIDSPFSNKFSSYIKTDIIKYTTNLDQAKLYMLKAGYDPTTLISPGFNGPVAIISLLVVATITLGLKKKKAKKTD
ncbi:MAG TPA: ABC transporter substrate-binding protein [Candidatus Bathyarchaeia archaeon]|nr:ABC transporter substrate-binding protein [Candidatus Bathyarchaeia archaeon]